MSNFPVPGLTYRHYKGGLYRVHHVALRKDDRTQLVVYHWGLKVGDRVDVLCSRDMPRGPQFGWRRGLVVALDNDGRTVLKRDEHSGKKWPGPGRGWAPYPTRAVPPPWLTPPGIFLSLIRNRP